MSISKLLTNIAISKPGKSFYQWCAKPTSERILNNTLPQIETVLSTACYVVSTARQKNIDKDRKNLLQIQNVASGVIGIGLGTMANKWVSKKADAIIKDLDATKMDAKLLRQASTGLRVILPIFTTALLMRCIIPTLTSCFSGKIMDKVRENKTKKQMNNQLKTTFVATA